MRIALAWVWLLWSGVACAQSVVVELFTSQGCSSCPLAEQYLQELGEQEGIIPLEWHVDYWDRLGWRDLFGDRRFSQRQEAYRTRGQRDYVYTPQMVVQGSYHAVGSDRGAVGSVIRRARRSSTHDHLLKLEVGPDDVMVTLGAYPEGSAIYELWAVGYDRFHKTLVERGENRGLWLENAYVVRQAVRLVKGWHGAPWGTTFPRSDLRGQGGVVLILQESNAGRVLAARRVEYR